jgi:hypothetical protein
MKCFDPTPTANASKIAKFAAMLGYRMLVGGVAGFLRYGMIWQAKIR